MTIPPQFLDELRTRLTLSDVIGRKVRLTRAGREFKGCCPFHNEKTPSFTVNDDKQFYHCFGCGAHGSVIDFVMNSGNLSFIEAIESLAAEAGMQVPKASPEQVKKANKAKSLHALLEEATRWMEEQLRAPENRTAYQYITERGVSEEQLRAYRIGYASGDGQAVRKAMQAAGYTDKDMIEAGVLRPSKKGGEPYAFFRERIMFPVPDRRGRIVAFGGRILPDHLRPPDKGDYTPAKYMNSSDTPLFHKGHMLYGEPHARQAAIDGQPVIVVEGYLDVMACAKAGYKGAVAPLGTALTESQVSILWKMIPQDEKVPILCFDGDNAGRRAAVRAVERILPQLKPNHSAKIAFLPEGQDPDSLINAHGRKAFDAVLSSALSLNDFLWQHYTQDKNLNTPEARAGLSHALEQEALKIPDRDVQYYYRQAFREKINKAFGRSSYTPRKQGKIAAPGTIASIRKPSFTKQRLIEAALLACMINHPDMVEEVEEQAGSIAISDKRLDLLRQHVLSTVVQHPGIDSEALRNHLIAAGFEEDLRGILADGVYTHAGFARPETEGAKALEGWGNALIMLENISLEQDLKQAVSSLSQDITTENEERFQALYAQKKEKNTSSGGGL
jgi:DNA primase